jgi:hypothetical protein
LTLTKWIARKPLWGARVIAMHTSRPPQRSPTAHWAKRAYTHHYHRIAGASDGVIGATDNHNSTIRASQFLPLLIMSRRRCTHCHTQELGNIPWITLNVPWITPNVPWIIIINYSRFTIPAAFMYVSQVMIPLPPTGMGKNWQMLALGLKR